MQRTRRHIFRASLRDTLLLLREFRTALVIFLFAILGGGIIYYSVAQQVGEPVRNFSEAIYLVLSLVFFQPPGEFPESPFLEAFFFVFISVGLLHVSFFFQDLRLRFVRFFRLASSLETACGFVTRGFSFLSF